MLGMNLSSSTIITSHHKTFALQEPSLKDIEYRTNTANFPMDAWAESNESEGSSVRQAKYIDYNNGLSTAHENSTSTTQAQTPGLASLDHRIEKALRSYQVQEQQSHEAGVRTHDGDARRSNRSVLKIGPIMLILVLLLFCVVLATDNWRLREARKEVPRSWWTGNWIPKWGSNVIGFFRSDRPRIPVKLERLWRGN